METTGLFQEAGPKKEVKELIKRIEAKQDIEWAKIKNPHTVSSTTRFPSPAPALVPAPTHTPRPRVGLLVMVLIALPHLQVSF